jgi:hypothetical protein
MTALLSSVSPCSTTFSTPVFARSGSFIELLARFDAARSPSYARTSSPLIPPRRALLPRG